MKGLSEKTAWASFRKHVLGPKDRGHRIENLVGIGFPDTNMCLNGIECWMEIKAGKEPTDKAKRGLLASNHPLSQEQKNWFLAQRRAKGLGFIYIETDQRRILLDGCKHGDFANEMKVPELIRKSMWWAMRPTNEDEWHQLWRLIAYHG